MGECHVQRHSRYMPEMTGNANFVPEIASAIPPQRSPRQRTVLIVDDDRSVRELIAVILECEGYRVLMAECGAAALAIAAEHHPDLVTLDVMMPDMDGWAVGRALADNPQTADIRRLVVSAKPLADLESAPARNLADAVLTKPFDFTTFVAAVNQVLGDDEDARS